MPGFQNMDIDPHPGVDFVGDVSDLSKFETNSVDEIFASNILEHFPHVKTQEVLEEWRRVLKPKGKLYVSVPDFLRTVQIYLNCGLGDWIQNAICGDQGYKTAFHYAIFDETRLTKALKDAGFSVALRVIRFDFASEKDCSNNKSSFDGKPVSLNMYAVK